MIAHHPNDALLLDYASGAAAEPISLLIATHLALCPHCRERVAAYEEFGGALIETGDTEAIPDSLKSGVLAALDGEEISVTSQPTSESGSIDAARNLPQPLRDYCGRQLEADNWQWSGFGIKKIPLLEDQDRFECYLLAIRKGTKVPLHDHGGSELTLVLDGSFSDDSGTFARGDIAARDEGDEHQPVADPETDCICLVVSDAPVSLKGPVGRLLNPFLGRGRRQDHL
ncbi:MAG TPA: anti-sigma factor [Rhodospirillaceae bacterium]|nr:anti-sigma factor [Rhodospirillaceae bacterium]HAA93359.1 anti-sigma factor [Rhodospirillaceae bacterium]HAT35067.1 anti-sigma factor [Rhodospirillaceae bacterium]